MEALASPLQGHAGALVAGYGARTKDSSTCQHGRPARAGPSARVPSTRGRGPGMWGPAGGPADGRGAREAMSTGGRPGAAARTHRHTAHTVDARSVPPHHGCLADRQWKPPSMTRPYWKRLSGHPRHRGAWLFLNSTSWCARWKVLHDGTIAWKRHGIRRWMQARLACMG